MPLFIGTRGNEILRWSASSQLLASLKEKLALRFERQSLQDSASLLRRIQEALDGELEYETGMRRDVEGLFDDVDRTQDAAALSRLLHSGVTLAARYFDNRGSVLAHFEIGNALHDRILARGLELAAEGMRKKGQGEPPRYALLCSGERGRAELPLAGGNHYFIVHEESGERIYLFSRMVAAALKDSGLQEGSTLWHGTMAQWSSFTAPVEGGSDREKEERLELFADLTPVLGDPALSRQAMTLALEAVQRERSGVVLRRMAQAAFSAPVATGLFGRFRVLRTGDHRGEIDLDLLALTPLEATLRILALNAGIGSTATLERIKWLLERGELDVEFAGRLLKAFQCFVQLKVKNDGASGCYINPHQLGEAAEQQFRAGVETVQTLQQQGFQKLFSQG